MKQRSLHRWLAIFFIAFALADCCFSDYCCEEKRIGPLSGDAQSAINIIANSDYSGNEHAPDPVSAEEECFCCCTHILPAIHFDTASLDAGLPENDLTNPHLPSPPTQNTFHPPRFS